MPRGTWLESARAKAPWTVEDTAELLCALDHLTDSSDSRCSEKSVTIRKIQNLLKQRRTHAQIAGKITHILKQYGNNHTRRRPEVIYKVGSKCLSGLPAELKREMLRYSAVVRDMQVTRYLAIEKRLRSGSTRDGPSLSNPRASTTELCSSSPAKGNIQALESSQRIKSEQSPSELKSRETSTAGKTLGTSLSFPQRDTSRLFVTSVADTLDCDDVNTVIQGPDNELQDHDHQCSPLFTPPSPEYLVRQSAARSVLSYEDPNLFQQSLEGQTVEQLLSVVHELYSDNLVFRDQLSTAKGELEKLNASERRNISVSKILSGKDDESVRAVIDNQLQRINELEKDKRNQVLLKPFLSLQMGKPPPLDLGSLQRDFIHLKSSFRSLLTITAFRYPAAGLASHADGDVGALFRASLRGSQAVELVETHVPASRMVLSMIGSALHEWVYLAEVQCAATMATPLFHEYKYYVSSICGNAAERNLDLAARKSTITSKRFQKNTLPTSAFYLAKRLFRVVSLFTKPKESRNLIAKVNDHLQSIFLSALRINSHRLLYDTAFKSIWPAPQDTFEEGTMTTRIGSEMGPDSACHGKSLRTRVKVALVPGIEVRNFGQEMALKAVVDVLERP